MKMPPSLHLMILCAVFSFAIPVLSGEELRIAGGIAPIENIFRKIQDPFEKETGIRLVLTETSSDDAILGLENGRFDVATTGVPWEELLALVAKGGRKLRNEKGLVHNLVGKDVTRILLNRSAKVTTLTEEQIRAISTGKVKNWKQVGGADLPVIVFFADKSPGLYQYWQKKVMNGTAWTRENVRKAEDLAEARRLMEKTPGAWTVAPSSIKPEGELIAPEIPVFGRPLNTYTVGRPEPRVQKLYEFIKGPGRKYLN